MSTLSSDVLALMYRPDLEVLFLRWPQPIYSLSIKNVYQQVLQLARETHARYWLFDIRSRGPIAEEDILWIKDVFYPSLNEIDGEMIHVAYLTTPSHAKNSSALQAVAAMRQSTWFGHKADFDYFTSEPDALLWLKKCRLAEVKR